MKQFFLAVLLMFLFSNVADAKGKKSWEQCMDEANRVYDMLMDLANKEYDECVGGMDVVPIGCQVMYDLAKEDAEEIRGYIFASCMFDSE